MEIEVKIERMHSVESDIVGSILKDQYQKIKNRIKRNAIFASDIANAGLCVKMASHRIIQRLKKGTESSVSDLLLLAVSTDSHENTRERARKVLPFFLEEIEIKVPAGSTSIDNLPINMDLIGHIDALTILDDTPMLVDFKTTGYKDLSGGPSLSHVFQTHFYLGALKNLPVVLSDQDGNPIQLTAPVNDPLAFLKNMKNPSSPGSIPQNLFDAVNDILILSRSRISGQFVIWKMNYDHQIFIESLRFAKALELAYQKKKLVKKPYDTPNPDVCFRCDLLKQCFRLFPNKTLKSLNDIYKAVENPDDFIEDLYEFVNTEANRNLIKYRIMNWMLKNRIRSIENNDFIVRLYPSGSVTLLTKDQLGKIAKRLARRKELLEEINEITGLKLKPKDLAERLVAPESNLWVYDRKKKPPNRKNMIQNITIPPAFEEDLNG